MSEIKVNYTNLRDAIIDKYWLQYLKSENGDYSTAKTEYSSFWFWFYENIYGADGGLEKYI